MPRKSPTTGARPHKEESRQTHFAEDIWNWIKENQNFLLLVITLVLVLGLFYVLNRRWSRQAQINSQVSLSKKIFNFSGSESSAAEIKRLKSAIQKYKDVESVFPWLQLQLARTYYEQERYQDALNRLSKLRNNSPGSPAAKLAKQLRSSIEGQLEYLNKTLPEKKQQLEDSFQKLLMAYGLEKDELPDRNKDESEGRKDASSNNNPSSESSEKEKENENTSPSNNGNSKKKNNPDK